MENQFSYINMDPILREVIQTDWITVTLVASLIVLIVGKRLYYVRFLNFILLPFNNKYLSIYTKKDTLFSKFHVVMSVFQIINTSLFISFVWQIYMEPSIEKSSLIFLLFLIAVLTFITLKTLLQLFNGFVFSQYKIFNELIFKKLTYLNYSGFILFIANVLLTFVFLNSKAVVIATLILFFTLILISWITVLKNYQKFISSNFSYFILYLCALEIAPLAIMGNFLK